MIQPEIRFKGFSDEWVEKKLSEVVGKIQSGNRLPKSSLVNGDVPYVVAQTKNDGVLKKIARGTLDYNGNPMKLFPGNSISFSIDNPEAMFYRNDEFYTSNIMRVIHEDHLTHEQYVFILENMKRFTKGYDWTHKFSGPVVSNLEYPQPSKEEQQKIGALFSKYDAIIALREQKLAELNALKKGMLQQMFPKNGVKVPELRFKGFADEWEERKLGEITEVVMGQSPHSINYTDNPQDHILVQGNADMKNGRVVPRVWTKEVTKMVDASYLILGVRAPVGVVGKTDYPVVVGRGVTAIKGNDFLYQYLQRLQEIGYWNRMSTGSTFDSINSQDVKGAVIQLPTLPEQQKIGQLFKHLDTSISNEQSKIEQLKVQKQGLLQKMIS